MGKERGISLALLDQRLQRLTRLVNAMMKHQHKQGGLDNNPLVDYFSDPSEIDHGLLTGLADDDHTQYAKTAGETMTGDLTMNGGNIVQTAAETVFGVNVNQEIAGCLQGTCFQDCHLDAGLVTLVSETSKQITGLSYSAASTYLAFAIRHATSGPTVDGVVRNSGSAFTIYMSAASSDSVLWFTYGR